MPARPARQRHKSCKYWGDSVQMQLWPHAENAPRPGGLGPRSRQCGNARWSVRASQESYGVWVSEVNAGGQWGHPTAPAPRFKILNQVLCSWDCIVPACLRIDLEGIVAKHKFSPYISEREASTCSAYRWKGGEVFASSRRCPQSSRRLMKLFPPYFQARVKTSSSIFC